MSHKNVYVNCGNGMRYDEHYSDGQLSFKGVTVSGYKYGYIERYNRYGGVVQDLTGYYLANDIVSKDNEDGDCYVWNNVVV